MRETRKGLLVMHYGTPATIADVAAYYTHIRRGRPPEPAALQDLIDRYQAIGGPSPLTAISAQQAQTIGDGLTHRGIPVGVYVGSKHASPFVADAVEQMAADNVTQAVGVVLAPHYSTFSVAQYRKYADDARNQFAPGMSLSILERWGTLPALIQALAERVQVCLYQWDPAETLVIFSAHSLPVRALAEGDPYQDELLETSHLVAEKLGIPHWTFAYQSASNTGEPWLGPDILEVIAEQPAKGIRNIVACTVGFVSDHLEVLYDLGIEARDKCQELGLNFRRAETINNDLLVMDALAGEAAKLFGTT
ncbi:MAG TPA: ferrochelatase [Fimbriimonas sp.]|nr:ferrochelatase [Fimbriimonas sp.]